MSPSDCNNCTLRIGDEVEFWGDAWTAYPDVAKGIYLGVAPNKLRVVRVTERAPWMEDEALEDLGGYDTLEGEPGWGVARDYVRLIRKSFCAICDKFVRSDKDDYLCLDCRANALS
jgi:hypothetical protein